ncbi:R3H domain-containing protein 4-like [Montipora capricornis]|uniref:R3H domain-containing protein 4-like n=1 Tax=Montipora capricornis TaxID=246305 RepID=UPI0035F125C1
MGVLNIQEHLRHRRNREGEESFEEELGLEDEFIEPTEVDLSQQEAYRRRPARQKSQKSKVHHYNNKYPERKVKTGNRKTKRLENTCFLLSLVDHEEVAELDINDFVTSHCSVFATLLADAEKLKIWNEFVSLSEEDQEAVIKQERERPIHVQEVNRGNTHVENDVTERDAVAVAEESFYRIEKRLRRMLKNKRFPLGGLKHHEEELISYFSDDPSAVMISNLPSSFDRLLVHGVCQFLDLKSTSKNQNGNRIMEIANKQETFCVPLLLLSQYLEQHR